MFIFLSQLNTKPLSLSMVVKAFDVSMTSLVLHQNIRSLTLIGIAFRLL